MSISSPFIHRPVATTLLTIAMALAGALAVRLLPVSPLPQVDYPAISVGAALPGADPQTMASAVATPLERQFGKIAGITEMTSSSYLGSTSINLIFDLNRDINAAARDVQAAINAAAGELPSNLPSAPSYRKVNPADPPVVILAITSTNYSRAQMYDSASSILQQRLSQVPGVGQVFPAGAALPAVRVEVSPMQLNNFGLGLEDVRSVLAAANVNRPKGEISGPETTSVLSTTDQLLQPEAYGPLLVTYRNGAPVRLSDVAQVTGGLEDAHNAGLKDGRDAILLIIFRQPGANIIETVDAVKDLIPQLQAEIPADMKISVAMDRTLTIRAALADVERTLAISVSLVILVVFFFLRDIRSTFIPSISVPISLIGTCGVMYLCNYNLDNLSLMAMTIATGFVVDDAIVVIENITRHLEAGMRPMQAALKGAAEIGFTVVSISVSLVAVFIPILLMGGYVGRLFREFAVVLSAAIGVSMFISLTTTPMLCAILLRPRDQVKHGGLFRVSEKIFDGILWIYKTTLAWALRNHVLMIFVTIITLVLTVWLYIAVPKDFFPQQDVGRITGFLKADQDTSFQEMQSMLQRYCKVISADKAIDNVLAFTGGGRGTTNLANFFIALKDPKNRGINTNTHLPPTADEVIRRLGREVAAIPGGMLQLQAIQDVRVGGRPTAYQYQFTLQGDNLPDLADWAPKLLARVRSLPQVQSADTDQQDRGLQAWVAVNRSRAQTLGINMQALDNTLYDAFGQRQVSTMYTELNQYHVVMEVDPKFSQDPSALNYLYVAGANGTQIPLSAFTDFQPAATPLQVNHTGLFPSTTISFNLAANTSLGQAVDEIEKAEREMRMPASIHGSFSGTAQAFQAALANEPILITAAIVTVYIVLGILYENLIHPITILSTLPSAGVGALLALIMTNTPLTVIALIGIILLIGIVKKNAIMMIDFALEVERREGIPPDQAIFKASLLRFRPITMTTMAALLGGLPLALGHGVGSEFRHPLGIAIVGGLVFSQVLTLYTTPVIYLYMDALRVWLGGKEILTAVDEQLQGRTPPAVVPA